MRESLGHGPGHDEHGAAAARGALRPPGGRMVPSVVLRYERSALRLAESSPDAVGLTDA
jgi:hypothetical protein